MTEPRERPIIIATWEARALAGGFTALWRPMRSSPSSASASARDVCPFGRAGDRLWTRETWREIVGRPQYLADTWHTIEDAWCAGDGPWRSPVVMPRSASRFTLELTGIAVRRVCEVTEDEARAAGAEEQSMVDLATVLQGRSWPRPTYRNGFGSSWRRTYGEESWEQDRAWVLTVKRVRARARRGAA